MSVSIEVNTLGFDPGDGGAVPSRTIRFWSKNVKNILQQNGWQGEIDLLDFASLFQKNVSWKHFADW